MDADQQKPWVFLGAFAKCALSFLIVDWVCPANCHLWEGTAVLLAERLGSAHPHAEKGAITRCARVC